MCDRSVEPPSSLARGVRRRSVITAIAAAPFAVPTTTSTLGNRAAETRLAPMPRIIPRLTWGPDLAAKGIIEPEEVRFLIIHHTEEPGSDYEEEDVPRLLAGMYNFHTGGDKGWPDLAYNFLVDKFGNIYEGRTGSTDGPVQGSRQAVTRGSRSCAASSATTRRNHRHRSLSTRCSTFSPGSPTDTMSRLGLDRVSSSPPGAPTVGRKARPSSPRRSVGTGICQ